MAGLTITTGAMQGQRIECDRPLIIGREDVGDGVDLVIDDAEMSRRHAVVTPVADGLEIEDLGSLNGTFVNGNRISGKVILEPNAEVKLGTTKLTVELPPADAPIVSPSSPTVISQRVTPPSNETIAPLAQPTVVRGQPIAPAAGADTPSDETIAPLAQPTVARSAPVVPDTGKTTLRDQPLISPQEPTVVRDVAKGLPTAQPSGGPGAPAGGPPNIPAPVRMVMKSPAGKLLLPIMLKLPLKARPLVPLLFLVLLIVGIVAVILLLV
jgi:pSer/pThr/pTyr-binding forkhead associated (FHA) protein